MTPDDNGFLSTSIKTNDRTSPIHHRKNDFFLILSIDIK
jgi:hypothetical protein